MKRKGYLYQNLYKFENIFQEYMTYYKQRHINLVHIMYLQYMNQRKEEL